MAALITLAGKPPVELVIQPLDAFYMLSALQLALRHPGIGGELRASLDRLAHRLQELITTLEALCHAGWQES